MEVSDEISVEVSVPGRCAICLPLSEPEPRDNRRSNGHIFHGDIYNRVAWKATARTAAVETDQ